MPTPLTFNNDVLIRGNVQANGGFVGFRRDDLVEESLSEFPIDLTNWRIWNAVQTLLTTAASDELGLTAVAFGTGTPYVNAGDINADANATRYARFMVQVPMNYSSGGDVQLRFFAGLFSGTAATGTVTLDAAAYKVGAATGALVSGSDLVTGVATTINSLTFANVDLALSVGTLNAGDWLDARVVINFSNDATARVPAIVYAALLCDTQG